jgi:DNA-binding MurR/RpiR family transcriptional regulator
MKGITMPEGGLLGRVRSRLPLLPDALRRVATQIVTAPHETARSTIKDLARRTGTSTATVTRFCRLFGFGGYHELRIAIAADAGRVALSRYDIDIDPRIDPGDPLDTLLTAVAGADARAIRDTAAQLDLAALDRVAAAVATSGRVELFGAGSSASAAAELAFRLQRIRVPCRHQADGHGALIAGALLGTGDVAIALSHHGGTRDVVDFLTEAGGRGALTVAVTSRRRSPVARAAQVVLTTAVPGTGVRLATLSALHSQLLIVDLIYVAVAQRTFARTTTAFEVTARSVESHRVPKARSLLEKR